MMAFKPRLTAPSTTDKHWLHVSKGGWNSCILISGKSCLPNCVGYAWGRFYEIMGKAPKLSRANAEMWFGYTQDGYKRGKTPKLGAVICWRKGKAGNYADGAGHVAIVEQIKADGSIVISESGYNAFRFRTRTLKPPFAIGGAYVFQGFIYNPAVPDDVKVETKPSAKVQFIKAVQAAIGAKVDGIAGQETLNKTVTVSAKVNSKHKVVKPIQEYLNHLGYDCGTVDGIAGAKFTAAVKKYQFDKKCVADGEITAKGQTWQKLLGLIK